MMGDSATWAVAVAFIVYGLLAQYANYGALNWVIAGVLALIVPWLLMGMKK
ncbi:MAG TPA: hypothetical protein VJJ76_01410 [archaeon]|nr:hypothetical protein [archaeon]